MDYLIENIKNELDKYYLDLIVKINALVEKNFFRLEQESDKFNEFNEFNKFLIEQIGKIKVSSLFEIDSFINDTKSLLDLDKERIKSDALKKFCVFLSNDDLNEQHFKKNANQIGLFIVTDWYLNSNQINYIKLRFEKHNKDNIQFEWDKDILNLKYAFDNFPIGLDLGEIYFRNVYILEKSRITQSISKLNQFELNLRLENDESELNKNQLQSQNLMYLRKMRNSTFFYFKSLTNLHFINGFIRLDDNVFIDLNNLTQLDLSFNKIDEISENNLNGLFNLIELRMCYCQINSIENNSFDNLINLRELYLSNNNLIRIKRHAFYGLINLRTLMLYKSDINKIDDYSFESLVSLNELYLSANNIKEIELNTFYGLIRLERLDLSNCKIESIQEKSFSCLINLNELYLCNNNIEEVKKDTFNGLNKLKKLNLSDCGIKWIEKDSFSNLINLNDLYFFSNECNDCIKEDRFGINMEKLRT